MPKVFFFIVVSLFIGENIFSQSGYFIGDGAKGEKILFDAARLENAKDEDKWIAQKLKRDLISDFINYSNITVIDSEEKSTISALQKEAEKTIYADEDAIELGKLANAKSYIKIIVTKKKDYFFLSAAIVNIETGLTEHSYTSSSYSENDFITKAHREAAVSLLESLGVTFTSAGKRLLQYGTFSKTESESSENLALYQAELDRLEKERRELFQNTSSLDFESQNARLDVQKATILQQKKAEEARLAQLLEDDERRKEEEIKSKERNEAAQKKILLLSNEIENRAAKIRAQKFDSLSALEQINVIEGEKQVLLANDNAIKRAITDFDEEMDKESEREIAERKAQQPRSSEMDFRGELNELGKEHLQADIDAIRYKYEQKKAHNLEDIKATVGKTQDKLREKIRADLKKLESATFVVDSLHSTDLYFRLASYGGTEKAQGWSYIISFSFGGRTVFTNEGMISFAEITGSPIPSYPNAKESNRDEKLARYTEFQDTVEAYDSLFRMNVPYLQAIVHYSVCAQDAQFPSMYDVILDKIEFVNLEKQKTVKTATPKNKGSFTYPVLTLVDWHSEEYRQKKEAENKRKLQNEWAYQPYGNGSLGGFGINLGFWEKPYAMLYFDVPLTQYFFADFMGGPLLALSSIDSSPFDVDTTSVAGTSLNEFNATFFFSAGLGVNYRLYFGNFNPCFYYALDIGGIMIYNTWNEEVEKKSMSYSHNLGLALPFGERHNLDIRYTLYIFPDIKSQQSLSAGFRYAIPTWVVF